MAEIKKEAYIKEKLNNFILFIEITFGKNNILLKEFGAFIDVDKGFEQFIRGMLEIIKLLELPMDTLPKKENNISKLKLFLEMKKLKASEEDTFKMLRYIELFYTVF